MRNRPLGSPFIASAGPGVLQCVPGSVLPISLSAQSLYARVPMQIEELRLLVVAEDVQAQSGSGANGIIPRPNPGLYVKAQVFAGPFGLTAGYVPICALSPRLVDVTEVSIADGVTANPVSNIKVTMLSQYRWKFDHPLPLGANESIQANLTYFNPGAEGGAPWSSYSVGNGTLKVWGSAVGRMINELPKRHWVPYAAGYVGQNNVGQSYENDLRNMLNRPLTVRRMIGRPLTYGYLNLGTATGAWNESPAIIPTALTGFAGRATFDQSLLAQAKVFWPDEDGSMQDYVEFAAMFPRQTRCWDVNKTVPQGRSVSIQWGGNPTQVTLGALATVNAQSPNLAAGGFIPVIGMLGEREEVRQ